MAVDRKDYPYVPPELGERLRKEFNMTYIMSKTELNAEEKLAYYKAIEEVSNYLDNCADMHSI